jgi:hypothetical protein
MIPQNLLDAINGTRYSSSLATHQIYSFTDADIQSMHRTAILAFTNYFIPFPPPRLGHSRVILRDNNVTFVTGSIFLALRG